MATAEAERVFEDYFCLFPWDQLPPDAEGFDMGCGSAAGPASQPLVWYDCTALILPTPWLKQTLADQLNGVPLWLVAASGLPPSSQDFGYSLGVLHHVPDTVAAIRSCAELLKPGAPLLLYLYTPLTTAPGGFAGFGSSPIPLAY